MGPSESILEVKFDGEKVGESLLSRRGVNQMPLNAKSKSNGKKKTSFVSWSKPESAFDAEGSERDIDATRA
jgi:hypothetical protein